MTLTPQQVEQLKDQLRSQVDHLPQDQKDQILKEIEAMSDKEIELMLKQQQEAQGQNPQTPNQPKEDKTIFRMLVDGDIESLKINENSQALAVLDINPISKGHTMVIPKKACNASSLIPSQAFTLAKSIAKKISSKLKAKEIKIETELKFGEAIIHILPVYGVPVSLSSQRNKAEQKELLEIQKEIQTIKRPKTKRQVIKRRTQPSSERKTLKLNRRIP